MPNMTRRLAPRQPRRRIWPVAAKIFLGCVLLAIIGALTKNTEFSRANFQDPATKVRETFIKHEKDRPHISLGWWLVTQPQPSKEAWEQLDKRRAEVQEIINTNRHIAPEAELIAERFTKIAPAYYQFGTSYRIKAPGESFDDPTTMVVSFMTMEESRRTNTVTPVFEMGIDGIIIPAVDLPKPIYAGVLLHEFGHARRHNRHDSKAGDPRNTDEHYAEEVEMHEFTDLVFNHHTNGAYMQLVDEIAGRTSKYRSVERAMAKISYEDYDRLDAIFGSSKSMVGSKLAKGQLALSVAFKHVDRKGLGLKGKIAIYKWFEATLP